MAKTKKIRRIKKSGSRALVLSSLELAPEQRNKIFLPTPKEFVKQRKVRGGGMANYVEVGYVVARLNEIFGAANWNFQVLRENILEKAVAVYGELMIKDHKRGFSITKGQYGNKERYAEIPIGDTLKAAGSDALKKCASLFGIALDVYWPELDRAGKEVKEGEAGKKMTKKEAFDKTKQMIAEQGSWQILNEWKDKITGSQIYNENEKRELVGLIEKRMGEVDERALAEEGEKHNG